MKQTIISLLAITAVMMPVSLEAAPTKESKAVRDLITKVNDHWQANNQPETRSF